MCVIMYIHNFKYVFVFGDWSGMIRLCIQFFYSIQLLSMDFIFQLFYLLQTAVHFSKQKILLSIRISLVSISQCTSICMCCCWYVGIFIWLFLSITLSTYLYVCLSICVVHWEFLYLRLFQQSVEYFFYFVFQRRTIRIKCNLNAFYAKLNSLRNCSALLDNLYFYCFMYSLKVLLL